MFYLYVLLACSDDPAKQSALEEETDIPEDAASTAVNPVVFPASDVADSTVDLILNWFAVADEAWFTEDSFGWDQFNPVYIAITGEDMPATIDMEQQYCSYIQENHPDSVQHSKCNPTYVDPNCSDGICLFTEYVTNGGAAIASSRQNDGYHLMIMAAKNPSPGEEDYKQVVLHEAFHIFQISQHTETDYQVGEQKLGGQSGDHDAPVPWWMEGVAEYMSILLYASQPGVDATYANQAFRRKLGNTAGSSATPVIDEYFDLGIKLYNIKYDQNAMFGYMIGAWFVAYLASEHGEQALFDFYEDVNEVMFADNFLHHFGKEYRQYVDEFEVFLQQPIDDLLSIIP